MRFAWATVVFVVFGVLAVAMGRSALRDVDKGVRDRDGLDLFSGLQGLVPTLFCGAIALVCPVVILMQK
jgi:hypothetical protein